MGNWLSVAEDEFAALRSHCLRGPDEDVAFAVASLVRDDGATGLLIREWTPVPPEHYIERSPWNFSIDSVYVVPWLKRAEELDGTLVLVHGHRAGLTPQFSGADLRGERRLFGGALGYFSDRPMAALLITPDAAAARLWWPGAADAQLIPRVKVVGPRLQMLGETPIAEASERHARQILALGAAGQRRLRSLKVAIVGAGGTGSLVIQLLAHLGVGSLLIVDPDRLEASNRSRVVGSQAGDDGKPKVDLARRMVNRIDPEIDVQVIEGDVRDCAAAMRLRSADIIFCCTDSHSSRALLNRLAFQYLVPVIDLGVAVTQTTDGGLSGVAAEVRPLVPGGACLWCQERLSSERIDWEYLAEAERELRASFNYGLRETVQPSVVTFNAVAAAHAVTLFQDMVTPFMGREPKDVLVWRGATAEMRAEERPSKPGCMFCAPSSLRAAGDAVALNCRTLGATAHRYGSARMTADVD